jgi:hypothetical protein
MAGFTNKGKYRVLGYAYRGDAIPANFYMALCTVASVPDADTNTMADLTEIAAGNGYTSGGYQLTPGAVDYDVWTEDDANDRGLVQCKDIVWTAVAGPIPSAGAGARYAVHIDDAGVVANREVMQFFDLGAAITISAGQTLTLQNCEFRLTE